MKKIVLLISTFAFSMFSPTFAENEEEVSAYECSICKDHVVTKGDLAKFPFFADEPEVSIPFAQTIVFQNITGLGILVFNLNAKKTDKIYTLMEIAFNENDSLDEYREAKVEFEYFLCRKIRAQNKKTVYPAYLRDNVKRHLVLRSAINCYFLMPLEDNLNLNNLKMQIKNQKNMINFLAKSMLKAFGPSLLTLLVGFAIGFSLNK